MDSLCSLKGLGNITVPVNLTHFKYCSALTPWEDYIVAGYLIVADLIAILLNTTVICLMYRLRNSLSHSDFFVVNLALSDLGHPFLGYPMTIAAAFSHRWTFGEIGCDINGFLGFYFGVTSMTTLGVLSIVRYISVAKPSLVKGKNHLPVYITLLLIQSYSLFWAISPLFGWGMYDVEKYGLSCTIKWKHPNKSYLLCSFVFCLSLPVAAMAFSYISIARLMKRTHQKMLRWKQNNRSTTSWSKQELRLLKISVIMLTVFMLAWTPYAIVSMVESFVPGVTIPTYVSLLPALCAKLSHILDPIIYFGMNKKFQRLAKSLIIKLPYSNNERSPVSNETNHRYVSSFAVSVNNTIQMKVL